MDTTTGALAFETAPDYENLTDSDGDNVYGVEVRVGDASVPRQQDFQVITVRITDVAESALFTDDPLVPGVTPVRAVHFAELRSRIDALREAEGLGGFAWTDPVLTPGVTPVRLAHLLDLRSALAAAYAAADAGPRRVASPSAWGVLSPGMSFRWRGVFR